MSAPASMCVALVCILCLYIELFLNVGLCISKFIWVVVVSFRSVHPTKTPAPRRGLGHQARLSRVATWLTRTRSSAHVPEATAVGEEEITQAEWTAANKLVHARQLEPHQGRSGSEE